MSELFAENIAHQVKAAFAETPYPGDENLVLPDCVVRPEWREVSLAFGGKRWDELSLEFVLHHYDALSVFTPEAYRYYLPAFVVLSLLNLEKADILPDCVIYGLNPSPEVRKVQHFQERIGGFTDAQRRALKLFLDFSQKNCATDDPLRIDIDKALKNLQG